MGNYPFNQEKLEVFKKEVIDNEGFILSDGTLNLNDLLSKAHDLMSGIECVGGVYDDISYVFTFKEGYEHNGVLIIHHFYGECEIKDEDMEKANYLWHEEVYNFFNEIAPEGYYFGSTEGDGACIGWFRLEEEYEV